MIRINWSSRSHTSEGANGVGNFEVLLNGHGHVEYGKGDETKAMRDDGSCSLSVKKKRLQSILWLKQGDQAIARDVNLAACLRYRVSI